MVVDTQKKEKITGEKSVIVEEEVKTTAGVVVLKKVKETLNIRKDAELGEKTIHAKQVIRYTIYGHKNKDGSVVYYLYFFIVHDGITEAFKVINKNTVIYMLSRMKHVHENRIEEYIPNFESERERIQLFDRLNDYERVLTDEDIEKQIDKVQHFSYFGEHGECKRAFPHIPHIIGSYSTVRYGNLPVFCTGRSGTFLMKNGKKVQLLKTESCHDGSCTGKYILFELEE